MAKVTVIIPNYNRVNTLPRAIESVWRQTFTDYELLVVQNGPFHHSRPIVERYRQKGMNVHYVHIERAGGANARNEGILRSAGDYVAFLDDDDEWLPSKLEEQIRLLRTNRRAGMVFSHPWVVHPDGSEVHDEPKFSGIPGLREFVEYGCVIRSLSGVMIRRDVLSKVGLLKTSYRIANDYDLYMRIARYYPLLMNEKPLYRYYFHENNESANVLVGFEEMIDCLRHVEPCPEAGVDTNVLEKGIRKFYRHYYGCAVDAMDAKDYEEATRYYARALRHEPSIGLRISWGRFQNPIYKVVKPYAAMAACWCLARCNSKRAGSVT